MDAKARGDRRMRERGMRKVSFWLTAEEFQSVRHAAAKCSGPNGSIARKLLLAWTREHADDTRALYERARVELA